VIFNKAHKKSGTDNIANTRKWKWIEPISYQSM